MPYKANAGRRHRIPKQRHRVTNWPSYEAGLRARGSLTVWFTEEAIEAWGAEPRTGRGGQPRYSALAITTALTLRAVFRLALRQTEGLIASIIALLGLDLAVPDHSTISRRAETLEVPRPRPGREPVHLLVDSTGSRPGRGRSTSSVSARRLMVLWSGTARSSPSRAMMEAMRPSVWRSARRNTARRVSAVVIARAE